MWFNKCYCVWVKARWGDKKGGGEEEGRGGAATLWSREDGAGEERAGGTWEEILREGEADRGTQVRNKPRFQHIWPSTLQYL